jgi:adenylyl- and sulfurtransferase ThiI
MESKSNVYIVVNFSELTLKNNNKKLFVKHLIKNIERKSFEKKINIKIINEKNKLKITSRNHLFFVPSLLKHIVGISYYYFVFETALKKESIEDVLKKQLIIFPYLTKYRISPKIIDKSLFSSKEKLIN